MGSWREIHPSSYCHLETRVVSLTVLWRFFYCAISCGSNAFCSDFARLRSSEKRKRGEPCGTISRNAGRFAFVFKNPSRVRVAVFLCLCAESIMRL